MTETGPNTGPDTGPLFVSSGDLVSDRRYKAAVELAGRGDFAAAADVLTQTCLLYTSPSPRDTERSRMPSSA